MHRRGSWRKLDISKFVDESITIDRFRRSKVDGLFGLSLQHCHIRAQDVVFVDDSLEQDINPARSDGILAIEFSETNGIVSESTRLIIISLLWLEQFLDP